MLVGVPLITAIAATLSESGRSGPEIIPLSRWCGQEKIRYGGD